MADGARPRLSYCEIDRHAGGQVSAAGSRAGLRLPGRSDLPGPLLLLEVAAVVVLVVVTAAAAFASEVRLVFVDEADATVNEVFLDIPDNLSEIGAPVAGSGRLEPRERPGMECESFEFEFHGSIQETSSPEFTQIRGPVDRTSICDGEPRHDVGELDLFINEFGTIDGAVIFPGEELRIGEEIPPANQTSNFRISLLTVVVAAAAVVNMVAAVICLLKRKGVWFIFGLAVSALLVRLAIDAANIGPEAGLVGISLAMVFGIIFLPLTAATVLGASRPAKPASWWARKGPAGYELAPPPVAPRSDSFSRDPSGDE